MRSAARSRITKETEVEVAIDLDRAAAPAIATGLPMLDHLMQQFGFHSGCSLNIAARSLDSIAHHVVEDVAIVLGEALAEALGDRAGIERYACVTLPMDDALVRAAVDFGGRAYARTDLRLKTESIEGLSTVLIPHLFSSFAGNARIAVHIDVLMGEDPHHCVEASFKALARACKIAWSLGGVGIASTKGVF